MVTNPEWIEESRKRATEMLSSGIMNTDTKPQRITNRLLDELGIKYVNEYPILDKYSLDNYLPDYNLAIEVMGDFWHANPEIYSGKELHSIQINNLRRDERKQADVYNFMGINILFLYESDLYKNEQMCKTLIQEYTLSKGNLLNYYSFNYSLLNGHILLNTNLLYPLSYELKQVS